MVIDLFLRIPWKKKVNRWINRNWRNKNRKRGD